ncbi:MAG: hypothetical protein KGI27_02190 [Thaumarchaeota archaeon]|nr:hypothetical protein [Nitrososphaerota archaeon]
MNSDSLSRIVPASTDPIRIVALNFPQTLTAIQTAPPPPPHLTYRGGSLLRNVKVFTIFWGSAWSQPSQTSLVDNMNKFFQFILTSPLIDQMGEYTVPQYKIGYGKYIGTTSIIKPDLKHTVTDKAIQHFLQQEIATNSNIPQPDSDTLYFVYFPPGVTVVQGGSKSCQAFCGYHSDIGGRIFYAAMPYPGCNGCNGASSGMSILDALTSTSSHELCEAITDAVPGTGWYDDNHGEIGDICAWKTKKIGVYTVQLEWSNNANSCI